MDRNDAFVQAVRASATPADDPIECTNFTGGGIRFSGFHALACRNFMAILEQYGKRAVFRLNVPPHAVLADCYDNIDPVAEPAIDDPSQCTALQLNTAAVYRRGAVVYTPFTAHAVKSEFIARILMSQATLDCILRYMFMTHLKVHSTSTSIVGGLQSQLSRNVRSQRTRRPRTIMFKPTAPSFKRRALEKQHNGRFAALLAMF